MGKCRDCVASLLGVCRGDFCYTERVALVERTRRAAAQLGHKLGPFSKVEKQPVWEARCKHCGHRATITIDPQPGQPAMYGRAVTTACPDRQPTGSPASVTETSAN